MNRWVKLLLGAAAVVGVAVLAAGPVMVASGPPPQHVQATVTINVPQRVGIAIEGHPSTLDPDSNQLAGTYPDAGIPYWVRSANFQIKVFSNLTTNFKVTVASDADFTPYDLYIAAWHSGGSPPPDPQHGDEALDDEWRAVGTAATNIVWPRPSTYGWETYHAALLLKLNQNDPAGTLGPRTLTYTIAAAQ